MDKTGRKVVGGSSDMPAGGKPGRVDPTKRAMITRPGFGTTGRPIQLESNNFKASVNSPGEIFYQYSVRLCLSGVSRFRHLLISTVHF